MARAPSLAAPTLSPFGGSGAGFGAFDLSEGRSNAAYLAFLKVELAYDNGKSTDELYLAAMETYAAALPAGSSTKLSTEQRVIETRYRVERNVIVAGIDNGTRELTDLLAYDEQHLEGLDPSSETYRDRRARFQQTQQQIFAEAEDDLVDQYQAGTLTTKQLQNWYRDQADTYAGNHELSEGIRDRITDLDARVLDERDSQAIRDYNEGKISNEEFLVYASAARARYAAGTAQAKEWHDRIETAHVARRENDLLYRFGLSQQYAELQRFIKSNADKGARTSTSTSKRIVLGADGKWHTVTSTSTHAIAPSPAEVAAHARLQVQLADAKKQMNQITRQLGAAPGGDGWVSIDRMLAYYQRRQGDLVRGSGDWYAMQQKIDSLQERRHAENVLAKQGIKISYPDGGSSTTGGGGSGGGGTLDRAKSSSGRAPGGGGGSGTTAARSGRDNVTIDDFMRSLGSVESGGRYDATNRESGAFGKYQIMPSNWPAWAEKYLGNADAKQTPENQEKVAREKLQDLHHWLGSWDAVAYWWLNGGSKATATNSDSWTRSGGSYVAKVMGNLGYSPARGTGTGGPKAGGGGTDGGGKPRTVRGNVGGLTELRGFGTTAPKHSSPTLRLRSAGLPPNLDGQAFSNFYSAYERAFESGQETFTVNSGGRPVTYFIGDDPKDRINRMRDLDDLRVDYYRERMQAYRGTASEIEAANMYNSSMRDMASHEYRILDTTDPTESGFGAGKTPNPIATADRLLDKAVTAIESQIEMANSAYGRGDFEAAYAHMQLAAHYLDGENGPLARINDLTSLSEKRIARIQAKRGVGLEDALGSEGGGALLADLDRLRNSQSELASALSKGDKLAGEIKGQIKVDGNGRAVLDDRNQVQLADGWARFVNDAGKVEYKRLSERADPASGGTVWAADDKHVKAIIDTGTTVVDVYAKWGVDNVGWIRGKDGRNFPLQGKTIVVNGKTMFEDPLNPGHWNSAPVVYNEPAGWSAKGAGVNTAYEFQSGSGKGSDGITYSLQWDKATGTYLVVGNRQGGFLQPEIKDLPVGSAGDVNVLDLLRSAGLTRDTTTTGGGGFVDIPTPAFGFESAQALQDYYHPATPASRAANRSGEPPLTNVHAIAAQMAADHAAAGPARQPFTETARRAGGPNVGQPDRTGTRTEQPTTSPSPFSTQRSALPSIRPLTETARRAGGPNPGLPDISSNPTRNPAPVNHRRRRLRDMELRAQRRDRERERDRVARPPEPAPKPLPVVNSIRTTRHA